MPEAEADSTELQLAAALGGYDAPTTGVTANRGDGGYTPGSVAGGSDRPGTAQDAADELLFGGGSASSGSGASLRRGLHTTARVNGGGAAGASSQASDAGRRGGSGASAGGGSAPHQEMAQLLPPDDPVSSVWLCAGPIACTQVQCCSRSRAAAPSH